MKRRVVLKAHVKPGAHSVIGHGNVKFLHVAMQQGTPTVWFEADAPLSTKDNTESHPDVGDTIGVLAVVTGEVFNKPENYVFLGSAVSDYFVAHVYVEKKYVGDHHN